jgi:transposase-like protein
LSLTAKGLTTGEFAAHFADVYGATVSRDTISRITDKVIAEMTDWCNRPLESVYPVVFIGAVHVKIRDGQSRKFYARAQSTNPRFPWNPSAAMLTYRLKAPRSFR